MTTKRHTVYCRIIANEQPKRVIIVGAIYRPTNNDVDTANLICKELLDIKAKNEKSLFWIGGDFNLPDIDWTTGNYRNNTKSYSKSIYTTIMDNLNIAGLKQIVDSETRNKNILDLFFTNNPGLILNQEILPGVSDHEAVVITSKVKPNRLKKNPRKIFLWNKCNIQEMKNDMNNFKIEFIKKYNLNSNVDAITCPY